MGIDLGISIVKLVLLDEGVAKRTWSRVHHGDIPGILDVGLRDMALSGELPASERIAEHKKNM